MTIKELVAIDKKLSGVMKESYNSGYRDGVGAMLEAVRSVATEQAAKRLLRKLEKKA